MKIVDLLNQRFGKLLVVAKGEPQECGSKLNAKGEKISKKIGRWKCLCDCGKEKLVSTSNLKRGIVSSCGCWRFVEDGFKQKNPRGVDLSGKKFGKLLVLNREAPIWDKDKTRRHGTFLCQCDCGNTKIIASGKLLGGSIKSCGCWSRIEGSKIELGERFGRLTVLEHAEPIMEGRPPRPRGASKCQCDCGAILVVSNNNLRTKNSTSCGCYQKDVNRDRDKIAKMVKSISKYSPTEASQRNIFHSYKTRSMLRVRRGNHSNNFNLTFEDFQKLIGQNCTYCGQVPNHKHNCFAGAKNPMPENLANGWISYNGLDRIDSTEDYTLDNVVTCCGSCNQLKGSLTLSEFIQKVEKWGKSTIGPIMGPLPIASPEEIAIIKRLYNFRYNDGNLSINDFCYLINQKCSYCQDEKNNIHRHGGRNRSQVYLYNGLDRIDSGKPHNRDNVVTCCKHCNWAKSDLGLEEFQNISRKILEYRFPKTKPTVI